MGKTTLNAPAIIGRIRHLMDQLKLRQGAFASRLGIDAGNFSKILSGSMPVTSGLVNRIVADLGVSKPWLVDGSGLPFERCPASAPASGGPAALPAGVPVYDIDVMAGTGELSLLFTDDRVIGRVAMPDMRDDAAIVRVSGDSMTPVIKEGAYIAIRPVSETSYIFWGRIYVILLDDYRLVKYLRKHPTDPDMVVLRSANPDYDDMDVARADIRRLFLVDAVISYETLSI